MEQRTMTARSITVRPAQERDRAAFQEMWADFVALAPGEPGNHRMGDLNWSRVMDEENGLSCILAVDETDTPVGFTLYLAFPFSWSRGDVCYLQDIYVRARFRGRGVARTMIGRLRELGEAAGWFKIFWMTQSDNFTAQRLYDSLAVRKDYIRYDLGVGEP